MRRRPRFRPPRRGFGRVTCRVGGTFDLGGAVSSASPAPSVRRRRWRLRPRRSRSHLRPRLRRFRWRYRRHLRRPPRQRSSRLPRPPPRRSLPLPRPLRQPRRRHLRPPRLLDGLFDRLFGRAFGPTVGVFHLDRRALGQEIHRPPPALRDNNIIRTLMMQPTFWHLLHIRLRYTRAPARAMLQVEAFPPGGSAPMRPETRP
jgi:hypothetical protein